MTQPNQQHGREVRAILGLGSNLGEREEHLRRAIAALGRLGAVEAISSLYETAPVGPVRQPDFVNAAIVLRTTLSPEDLLAEMLAIEQQHGRDRRASLPKGPRTLDLDLLAYGDVVMETPSLTLPHPALAERRFVLEPLAEIAPAWRHPVSGKTAAQLLAELPDASDAPNHNVRRMESSGFPA